MKTTLLTAAVLLSFSAPIVAEAKPALPKGDWESIGHAPDKPPVCSSKPFMTIDDNSVIIRAQGGVQKCKVVGLKYINKILDGTFKCKWITHELTTKDFKPVADDIEFGIIAISPDRINYNNALYGRCPSVEGAR